jgi:hypothetical protein
MILARRNSPSPAVDEIIAKIGYHQDGEKSRNYASPEESFLPPPAILVLSEDHLFRCLSTCFILFKNRLRRLNWPRRFAYFDRLPALRAEGHILAKRSTAFSAAAHDRPPP